MINSKAKGNKHEREVAKLLSEWSGKEWHRTPMSGALHWKGDKRVISDIVPPADLDFPFSIECKNVQYPWEFNTILEGTSTFWKHWEQCYMDAEREDLFPMLVFTKNYRETFVAIRQTEFDTLLKNTEKAHLIIQPPAGKPFGRIAVMNFKEFLEEVTLEEVTKKLK